MIGTPLERNAMGLANARFNSQNSWFGDQRTHSLTALVLEPLQANDELGLALDAMEAKLRATSYYPALFSAAFGTPEITRDRVARALAQFLQSLMS